MPIPKAEFKRLELMEPPLEDEVRDFLQKHPESAYTPMEIVSERFKDELIRHPNLVQYVAAVLENLRSRKTVEGRFRQGSQGPEYYYGTP